VTLRSSRPRSCFHFLTAKSRSRCSSGVGSLRWMKLQKPPRTQPSPLFSRQQASRKSVTGESSQYTGRAACHRELSASHAACAESSYLNRAYTLPIRSVNTLASHHLSFSSLLIRTVIVVIADDDLLNLAILAHLAPDILVKSIEMVLDLARVHLVLWVVGGILVEIWHQDGLRVRRLDVLA
jgi:hypothetical protein